VAKIWTGHPPQRSRPEGVICSLGTMFAHDMQVIGWAYNHDRDHDGIREGVAEKYAVTLQCRRCLIKTDTRGEIVEG